MAKEPAAASPLAGSEWLVEMVAGKTIEDHPPVTLGFANDGRVFGSGGCNRYGGPVTITATEARFGALVSTRMACPPPLMPQEHAYFSALSRVTRWQVTADSKLILSDDAGAPLLVCHRRAP